MVGGGVSERWPVGGIAGHVSPWFPFPSLCGAGSLADGLVTSKMKMKAVKFACANFSSPR